MLWSSTLSTQSPVSKALDEVCEEARRSLGGAKPDAAFLFVSGYPTSDLGAVAETVLARTGARHLLGCTAGGVLGGGREVEQRPSASLTLAHLPGVEIHPFHLASERYPDGDEPPSAWHSTIGVTPDRKPAFLILPDPFTSDAERLIAGLDYAYPGSPKVGGLASGGQAPGMNRLFLDGATHRAGSVGLALSGALVVETAVAQGCRPVGAPGKTTRAQGHYLIEVDGKRALDFVQEQIDGLDEHERELARMSLFLGIAMDPFRDAPPEPGDFLIRNFLGVDPDQGVVAVGEQLAVGRTVQLHVRDAQASTDDLLAVLRRTVGRGASPQGALLFSCLGRGQHLYGEPDKDSKLFQSVVGDVPLGGFFCNGEIGPVGGETYLHGFTSSFGLFRAPAGSGA